MNNKLKLCFMGSPEFAVPSLKKLLESGHDIPVVFTQKPRRFPRRFFGAGGRGWRRTAGDTR